MSTVAPPVVDRLLRVRGTVQGVGFRPFVARLAGEAGLRGWVLNDADGVLVRVVGEAGLLEDFARSIQHQAPNAARVVGVEWVSTPSSPGVGGGFEIVASRRATSEISTGAPPDLAPCEDCLRELRDPGDRRFGYPFINCTQCGPRYSIIEQLPYDRPKTTMVEFSMCSSCAREYGNPRDRRFHAEPNACPDCGPQLELTDSAGRHLAGQQAALDGALECLRDGGIVAVKGIGGFHLMADATDEVAVAELRRRKHREEKPFGVMFRNLEALGEWAVVSGQEAAALRSPAAPMVLVPAVRGKSLASGVAPGNPWIGALLPSAPLHIRIVENLDRPLVATSANLAEEPLCVDDDEARARLEGIADLFLGHNRRIARPVDDSVVRLTREGAPVVLRRARGYAPSPFTLPASLERPLICVGAEMKNTVAVASQRRLVVSPHIGDLSGTATLRAFRQTLDTLSGLLGAKAEAVVCDKHPDYHSTRFAEDSGLPRIAVQHHLAHVLAVLLEHGRDADDVLGVAWDGTGYGEDRTVWGGEFLLLEKGRASRFACMRPFRLAGGEAAVRDARRVALALARETGLNWHSGIAPAEETLLSGILDRGLNSPECTSAGRLFDGFGALLGLAERNQFEGQVPLAVEAAAARAGGGAERLPFGIQETDARAEHEIDWRPAVEACLAGQMADPCEAAAALHRGLTDAIVEVARRAGLPTVVLCGGCFQNVMLRTLAERGLVEAGFEVLAPRELPPGDGAIAAGQALAALWNLTSVDLPDAIPSMNPNPTAPCASPSPEK